MPDLPAASLGIVCGYFFWRWLKQSEWSEVFGVGVTLGLVLLTKLTWVILFFLIPFLWIIWFIGNYSNRSWKTFCSQFSEISVILITGVLVLNIGYGFEGTFTKLGDFQFASQTLAGKNSLVENNSSGNRFANTPLRYIPVPFPYNYVIGADLQKVDFEKGLPSYLNGEWSDHGWRYYYLYTLFVKTPLGTIGLFFLAIFCTLFQKDYNISWRDEMVILLPGIALLISHLQE